jgi:hypothetical protein
MPPVNKLVPQMSSIANLLAGRCGELAVGDVLAFHGLTRVDEFIQGATKSAISHVAILMRAQIGGPLLVLEATGLGVTVTPLEESLQKYDQEHHTCFYLPLKAEMRAQIVPGSLAAYYNSNALDKYNYDGVVEAGIYDLDHPLFQSFFHVFHGRTLRSRLVRAWYRLIGRLAHLWAKVIEREPSTRRLFCSQLVTESLQAIKVLGATPKARLVVPVEVCWFDIYGAAYQLNGDGPMSDPFRWGDAPPTESEPSKGSAPPATSSGQQSWPTLTR